MRKNYSFPTIRQMRIGTNSLLAGSSLKVDSTHTITESANGGWSKQFWGLTDEDEEPDSEFDWQ